MCCILKRKKTHIKSSIASYSFNDFKEGFHYIAVKQLPTLLRRRTSKYHSEFLLSEFCSFFCNRKQTEISQKSM